MTDRPFIMADQTTPENEKMGAVILVENRTVFWSKIKLFFVRKLYYFWSKIKLIFGRKLN